MLNIPIGKSDREYIENASEELAYRSRISAIFASHNNIEPDAISGATKSKLSLLLATKDAMEKYNNRLHNIKASEFKEVTKNTDPKKEYYIGGHLDLNALKVNLVRADGSTKTVPYSEFKENSIDVYILRKDVRKPMTESLEQGYKLEVVHRPSKTAIVYDIVVTKEVHYVYISKIKYKLTDDKDYREAAFSTDNSNFIMNINIDENVPDKRIKGVHLYDSEGEEIKNVKYQKEFKDISFESVNTIDSTDKVLNVLIETTDEMRRANKMYKFNNVEIHFLSKTGKDLSKTSWVEFETMPVNMKNGLAKGDKVDYTGKSVKLFEAEGKPKELCIWNGDNSMSISINKRNSDEEHTYKDPVVYKVVKLKQLDSSEEADKLKNIERTEFKTVNKVGEKLDLRGLVIELLDEHRKHPDNNPQNYDNSTPDYIKYHENMYYLVHDDGTNSGVGNLFKNNNITLNIQNGQSLTKKDTKLIITYTNR